MNDMNIEKPIVLDILDTSGAPALSSTSDMPVIETKPDAQNEGAPPAAATEPEEVTEAERPEESATSATEETPAEPAKKESRGVQKALDRLTAEREEAKRRADAAEQRLDAALKALESTTGRDAEQTRTTDESDPEPVRPVRGTYPDPDAWENAMFQYAEDKASWVARREVAVARVETQQAEELKRVNEGLKATQDAYNARKEKVKAKYDDYDVVAENNDVKVSIPMAHAILHSENGPELQYYLGAHPKEAERIAQLPAPFQLMELGRLEAKILNQTPDRPAVSAAPKPVKPVAPSSETPPPDQDSMSMDEYAKTRRAAMGMADPQDPKARRVMRH